MGFFDIIIQPFIFIIKEFFSWGYAITHNYGWAIILLSFFISLLLLPVFVYIERQKKKTDAVKRKMQPLVDEIKRVYKGQERYYYIRTLHRQHGYSPFKAMVPILSLLLQIPFFIAAYLYLEHFEPLHGVSFWFIKDLSKPDGLLGKINILPIAMTLVNLITAYFYTRNGDKKEFNQMLVVAVLFLVLLFNLPSGLVLYWTMNNVFSFFRLFVTNPEVFKWEEKKKITVSEFINNFKTKPSVYYSLLFLSVYFYLAALFYYTGFNYLLALVSLCFLFSIEFISTIYILKYQKKSLIKKLLFGSASVLIVLQFTSLYFALTGKSFGFHPFSNNLYSNAILSGIFAVLLMLPYYIKENKTSFFTEVKPDFTIFLLAVLYLTGFIFLWNPLNIYSSYPANFVFPAINILKENIGLFISFFIGATILYIIIPKKAKTVFYVIILVITFMGFIHNTLFPIKVGSLQETKFLYDIKIAQPLFRYLIEAAVFIFVFWSIIKLSVNSGKKYVIVALALLNIILISDSLYSVLETKVFFKKETGDIKSSSKISFSKDKENYIFIISDMFYGWYIKKILEDSPELKDELSGFVWYPNTLSISPITATSMPAIIGGYDFTIDKLNKDSYHTLLEKMTRITERFYDKIKGSGWRFTATDMIYSKIEKKKFDSYLPRWSENWDVFNVKYKIGISVETGYELLWENALFYTAPLFLKPVIYNKSYWLYGSPKDNNNRENTNSAKRYNFLRILPSISDTKSDKSSFIYIHTEASHHPWCYVDDNGVFHENVSPYENNKWVIKTFARWFKWMKENGVYDNTKIVLLSDHGVHWWNYEKQEDTTLPLKNIDTAKLHTPLSKIKMMYPLLMVKDFYKKDRVQEDWRFMSNADASYIIFNKKNPTNITYDNIRVLPSIFAFWERKIEKRKRIQIGYAVKAEGSAFDMSKWKLYDPDTVKSNVLEELFGGNTGKLKYSFEQEVEFQMEIIRNTPEWFKKIKEKAKKNNRSVEEQLEIDATWVLNHQKKKEKTGNNK